MSKFINFILVSLFLISCHYRYTLDFADEERQQESLVKYISNSTVVLLAPDDESKLVGSCAGVFVSSQKILTAKHCLEPYLPLKKVDTSDLDISELIKILGLNDQQSFDIESLELLKKDWSKVNEIKVPIKLYSQLNKHFYKDKSPSPYFASLLAIDSENDLALLIVKDFISNEFVTVSKKDVYLGQKTHVIGHPASLEYTYHQGFVSGERFKVFESKLQHYLQISSPVFNGNSGGGVFDNNGNLLGICSIYLKSAPQISYFVHANEISKFLEETN